jgi:hypothetical protein
MPGLNWASSVYDSGHGLAVKRQDVLLRTIPHSAIRGPSAVLRHVLSPSSKVRPCARQEQADDGEACAWSGGALAGSSAAAGAAKLRTTTPARI